MYYTLFLCCPRTIISKSALASSTNKILLIDDAQHPLNALYYSEYILKNTSNQVLVLLLSSKSSSKIPKMKKKGTNSESEKRLDFDEDLKSKSQLRLESLYNENSN